MALDVALEVLKKEEEKSQNRLQNSRIFCERERRSIFQRKVWSKCKNGEGEWGETLKNTTVARALHTRGSRLPKMSENDCFAVYAILKIS